MAEDKDINVNTHFNSDGADKVAADAQNVKKEVYDLNTEAGRQAYANSMKEGAAATNQADAAVKNVTNSTKQLNGALDVTYSQFRALRFGAQGLMIAGQMLVALGAAMTAPFVLAANEYIKTVGRATVVGQQWADAQTRIKEDTLQIGEVAATAMLPALEKGADIMDRVAQIVAANPWIVQAALGVGTVLGAIGSLALIVSKLAMMIADMALFWSRIGGAEGIGAILGGGGVATGAAASAATGGGFAAAGAGGGLAAAAAGAAPAVATALMVALAAELTRQGMNKALGTNQSFGDIWETARKGIFVVEAQLDSWNQKLGIMSQEQTDRDLKMTQSILGLNQALDQGAQAADDAHKQQLLQLSALPDFIQYQKQLADATAQYQQQRSDIITSTEQQIVDSTQQYEQQRAQTIQQYNQQVADATTQFTLQQAQALEQYNMQVANEEAQFRLQQKYAEYNHQLEMANLKAEYDTKIRNDTDSRDALALVRDQAAYQQAKSQKDAQYNEERAKAKAEEQLRLAEMANQFAEEQKFRTIEFQNRLAQMQQQEQDRLAQEDANHALEMEKMAAQEKDKLAKLDDQYKQETDKMKQAFVDRLNAINTEILGDTAQFNHAMEVQADAFAKWIHDYEVAVTQAPLGSNPPPLNNPPPTGGGGGGGGGGGNRRALGGYAAYGTYVLGDHPSGGPGDPEFVLDARTTRSMESMVGGRLTQEALMKLAGSRGVAGGSVGTIVVQVNSRSLTLQDIRTEVSRTLDMKLRDLLPAFGVS